MRTTPRVHSAIISVPLLWARSNLQVSAQLYYQLFDFIIINTVLRIVGSRTALERAKFNLETLFSVVGVVGREEETLRALDAYLPLFARGAQKLEKGKFCN